MTQPQTAPQAIHGQTPGQLPQLHEARNAGLPLDLDWVARVQANTSAIERRAATLSGRRTVKKSYQAAWLARPSR
jgi:deoxyribose-phosphate aldolase